MLMSRSLSIPSRIRRLGGELGETSKLASTSEFWMEALKTLMTIGPSQVCFKTVLTLMAWLTEQQVLVPGRPSQEGTHVIIRLLQKVWGETQRKSKQKY